MPGTIPSTIWLYRIIHCNNLKYILQNGIYSANSENVDANYINIGDSSLIRVRSNSPVAVSPYGNLSDYIPFYFGPLSPMLFRIVTGFGGVIKRKPSEIIYLITSLDAVEECNCKYIFFDGHAIDKMSHAYAEKKHLEKIDWDIVKEKDWKNTAEDRDKQRRKQAEMLIYHHVPVNSLRHIVVYDKGTYKFVQGILEELELLIPVKIHKAFYY